MIYDEKFLKHMTMVECAAWSGFVGVVRGFLSGSKNEKYKDLVNKMLTSFHSLGARMSIKVHFLFGHLEKFPENPVDVSEEQGGRFHEDIKVMEELYQRRWDVRMIADYCWSLMRESPEIYGRKSPKRTFLEIS